MTGEDSKAGALSHEMSHFIDIGQTREGMANADALFAEPTGGTEDYIYGAGPARNLATRDPDKALRNADNFEYYIEGAKPDPAPPAPPPARPEGAP